MRNKKKGFTLVEILVVVSVFSIMVGSILSVVVGWQRSWNISKVQMDIQFEARRAMSEITKELSQTGRSTVNINATNDVIIFQLPNNDYAGGTFTWGDQIQYSLILGPTGNKQLWRTDSATGQAEVLANYVIDIVPGIIPGVQFVLANDVIRIQLKVGKTPKGGGKQSEILLNSQVSLRNI